MNLLIVDDNIKMRNMIKEIFKPYFKQIYECGNGSSAISEYTLRKPDWVFMDIKMNGINGITATGKIKASFPDARILIVTGFNDPDFRNAAESSGAMGYVLKENLYEIFNYINK